MSRSIIHRPLKGGLAALAGAGLMSTQALAQPLLVIEKADLSQFAPSDKDAALVRAIQMAPARLRDLQNEIPDFPAEALPVMEMLIALVAHEGSFAITHDPDDQSQLMGYGMTFRVETDNANDAEAMQQTVLAMLAEAPMPIDPSERWEGMSQISTPAGQVHFGPSNAGGESAYVIQFGVAGDPQAALGALPESPRGMTSIMRAHMDFAALNPIAQMGRQMAGGFVDADMVGEVFGMLEESGLVGERTIKIDYNAGFTDEYSIERFSIIDARHAAEGLGLPIGPLSQGELRAIPGDAVMASIARFDFDQINKTLDMMADFGIPVDEGLGMIEEQTGIDIREDLIGALGNSIAAYTSDSTGGGSLLSGVVLLGVGDHDRLAETHAKLAGLAGQALQMNEVAAKYVSIEAWNAGGHELVSLHFNGIPIPLELTWALTEDWLVMGLTPQAVLAAVQQASGEGDDGLASNAAFRQGLERGREYVSINYLDAQRLARGGYPLACLLGSAVANGVRSPGLRDPGMIVPTFHDLMDGARASVGGSYWDGDDYITEWRGDRSVLVQTSVMGGAMGQFAPLIAAAMLPAIAASSQQFSLDDLRHDPMLAVRMLKSGIALDPFERVIVATLATQASQEMLDGLKGGLD